MSDKFDEYRAIAAYCERMFREAKTLETKTSWLRLAMNWLALIPKAAQVETPQSADNSPHTNLPDNARLST